jgi:hypothetical protein
MYLSLLLLEAAADTEYGMNVQRNSRRQRIEEEEEEEAEAEEEEPTLCAITKREAEIYIMSERDR